MTDPIVDEVRRARNAHAAGFNYDLDAIFQDIKKREAEGGLVFVQGAARQPAPKQRMQPTGVAIPLPADAKTIEAAPAAER